MNVCIVTAPELLVKQPADVRQYTMDFSNLLASNESLESLTSITHTVRGGGVSDLTVNSTSISGNTIAFWISGGTDNTTYRLEILVVTTASQTLEGDGLLSVRDK